MIFLRVTAWHEKKLYFDFFVAIAAEKEEAKF
jgi:hypothetical protein